MNKTKIEWIVNPDGSRPGWSWNPLTGCLNNCSYCYARKLANERLRERYLANKNTAPRKIITRILPRYDPFYPRFWEDRLYEPVNKMRRWGRQSKVLHTQEPKGIFVCDMSDLFGIGIPTEWTERVMEMIKRNPMHRFYLLTKQPQNLPQWSPFPDNCWVGVTVCNEPMFQEAMKYLPYIQASIKYISIEPMLSRILTTPGQLQRYINWVIIGAQTRPTVYPKIEWIEEIVRACDKAGVPVFLKDNLKPLLETLDITRTSFGRLTSLTVEAIKDTQGLPRQRGWYELRQELPDGK